MLSTRRVVVLLFCVVLSPSCSTEPSGPYLHGTWSSPSLGAVATPVGLRLTMVCGGTGWFDGPLTLDSLNIFSGSGYVRLDGERRNELIVGVLTTNGLHLQWGPPNQPPDVNGELWFLLPDEVGRPTEDPC
jgi:hypothetical protein